MGSIMPPIEQWVETGRSLTRRVRKTYTSEIGILFDVIDSLETSMNTFESVFGVRSTTDIERSLGSMEHFFIFKFKESCSNENNYICAE